MNSLKRQFGPVGTLIVIAVLVGAGAVSIPVLTRGPLLALPSVPGLPGLIPPLRLTPLGLTSGDYWAADVVGLVVMVLVAAAQIGVSHHKRPGQGRVRAFTSGVWATVLGVVAGNIIRLLHTSVVVQMAPLAYVGFFVSNVIVSALWGLVIGLVVGLVAALTHPRRNASVPPRPEAVADPVTSAA